MTDQPLWKGQQAPVQRPDGSAEEPGRPGLGRGRTVALVAFAGVALVALIVAIQVFSPDGSSEPVSVAELSPGDCLASPGLATPSVEIRSLDLVACADAHDAEVFAVLEFESGEDLDAAADRCLIALEGTGRTFAELDAAGLQVRPLAEGQDAGDAFACFVRRADGAALTGPEFDRAPTR